MSRPPRIPGTRRQARALYVLPSIDDALSTPEKNMLAARNACAVEGRCPLCGTTGTLHPDAEHPGIWHLVFAHEPDCPVGDAP